MKVHHLITLKFVIILSAMLTSCGNIGQAKVKLGGDQIIDTTVGKFSIIKLPFSTYTYLAGLVKKDLFPVQ